MKLACHVSSKLRGMIQIWFNSKGYNVKLEPETKPRHVGSNDPLPPKPNDDKSSKYDDKDQSVENDSMDMDCGSLG